MIKVKSPSKKKNILLIDDDIDVWKELLYKVFPNSEYELNLCKKMENVSSLFKYDLLIVDYFLEDEKTGKAWVEKNIRNRDPYIPVIFWTSSYNPEIIKETIVGDKVFFKKVLDLDLFKKEVDKSINKYRKYHNFPLYNSFFDTKIISARKRELAHKIYVNTSKYLESFFAHSKYHSVFNDHGLIHAQNVLNNLSKLMYPIANEFTEDQFLVAYIATILHDFGMIPVHYNLDMEYKNFKNLRSNHAKTIFWWLISGQIEKILEFDFEDYIDNNSVKKIKYNSALITLYHDCKYEFNEFFKSDQEAIDKVLKAFKKNEISKIYNLKSSPEVYFHQLKNFLGVSKNERYRTIAGLVALADKLDYGESRMPVSMIKESPYRSLYDEYEYLMNWCFHSYKFDYYVSESEKRSKVKLVLDRKVTNRSEHDKFSFNDFKEQIFNDEGIITKTSVNICSNGLQNTIKKKVDEIFKCFTNSGIDFLEKLKIEYRLQLIDQNEIQKESIFRNINYFHIFDLLSNSISEKLKLLDKALLSYIFDNNFKIKKGSISLLKSGFSSEKVLHVKELKKTLPNNFSRYNSNACIIKIGENNKIHNEVLNYKKFAVPYINPRSLIGYIDEYRYLDRAAFLSYITPTDAKELDNIIDYSNINKISDLIKCSISIFYKNIVPKIDYSDKKYLLNNKRFILNKIDGNYLTKVGFTISEIKEIYEKSGLTISVSHGDFTFRNILKLQDDYIFIDFYDTGINHFFLDFAKLEHFIIVERLIKYNDQFRNEIVNCYKDNSIINNKIIRETLSIKWCLDELINQKLVENGLFDVNTNFEMNLARLLINLHTLTYKKDFPLTFNERLTLVHHFWDKVKNDGGIIA